MGIEPTKDAVPKICVFKGFFEIVLAKTTQYVISIVISLGERSPQI